MKKTLLVACACALAIAAPIVAQTRPTWLRGPAGQQVTEIKGSACTQSGGTLTCTAGAGGSGSPGGLTNDLQKNDGAGGFAAYSGTSCAYAVKTLSAAGSATCTAAPTIPADISGAHYVTTQAEAGLSAEAVLPTCTGTQKLTFNGTTVSCATDSDTVYSLPALTASVLGGVKGNGALACSGTDKLSGFTSGGAMVCSTDQLGSGGGFGAAGIGSEMQVRDEVAADGSFAAYLGTSCSASNWISALSASGVATCAQPAYSDLTGTPASLAAEAFVTIGASTPLTGEKVVPTCSGNDKLTYNGGANLVCATDQTGSAAQYQTLQEEGTSVTQRATLNVIGPAVTVADDAVNSKTKLTVVASGTGSCTNQFVTATNDGAAPTCTTDTLASAQHANQGTTTQVLHGNAAGNPSWSAVSLTADVTGVLPLANGGTNANLTASNGAVAYSGSSALALSAVGTSGRDFLLSGGAGAPTWARGDQYLLSTSDLNGSGTTFTDIPGLTFSVASGSTYQISCKVAVTNASTTNGGRVQVVSPAVTSATYTVGTMATSATVMLWTNATAAAAWPAACTTACIAQRYMLSIEGVVVPSAAGTWKLQAAFSAAGTTLLASKGSWCSMAVL